MATKVTAVAAITLGALPLISAVAADVNTQLTVDIAAQLLETALVELSRQGHLQLVIATSSLPVTTSVSLHGSMPLGAALDHLLKDTGLTYRLVGDHTIAIVRTDGARQQSDPPVSPGISGDTNSGSPNPDNNVDDGAKTNNANRGNQPVSHRNPMLRLATFLGFCLSTSAAGPVCAEDAPATGLQEIFVTARRFEERLQDVPISITVYNQAQISERNITTASDLATYTPSLTSNNRFGADKSSFTIRGFSQDGKTAPTVGVYFADVVALRANSGTGGSNGTGPGAFFDLQNVQVLKGPQGTLFGRNTTGGVILLVPQRPTDRLEGYVEGSAGNYDMRRAQAVLNVPLTDTVRVRFGVDGQKRDGYLRNRSGIGPEDFADINYIALRGSVLAKVTPNLENYFVGNYSRSDTNGYMFKVGVCNRGNDPNFPVSGRALFAAPLACNQVDRQAARGDGFYDVENIVPNPNNTITQWQGINTTTWTASDALTIKNIASYGEYREKIIGGIGGEFFVLTSGAQAGLPLANVITAPAPGAYNNIQSAFTEELQFQGRAIDNRLKWQTGAYLELSKPMGAGDTTYSVSFLNCSDLYAFHCFAPPTPFTSLGGLGIVYNKIENRNIGFYGQGTYEFSDKLALTAGARYTIDRMEGHGGRLQLAYGTPNTITRTACTNPRFIPASGNLDPTQCDSGTLVQKSSRPTWVVDFEYKPIPNIMAYAKYARGYRQGGVDPSIIGLERWQPETVNTYELGSKTSFSGAVRGYFNFAAFYNDFQNQQLAVTAVGKTGTGIGGARIIINAGKSRIWGLEADASANPFNRLKLDLGYAYLDTKLQAFSPPDLSASPYQAPPAPPLGGDLPLSPHHRLTATATYTLPLDEDIGQVSLGATYVYTSKQVAAIDTSPFSQLPSSKLLNLNLSWESIRELPVDFSAFVTNVTQEQFPVNVGSNWSTTGYESFVTNAPRMWGLRLRYRFGE